MKIAYGDLPSAVDKTENLAFVYSFFTLYHVDRELISLL